MLGFIWFSMAVKQLDSVKKRNLQRKRALEISNQHLFVYLFHNGNASFKIEILLGFFILVDMRMKTVFVNFWMLTKK
jgi:hypothetical protein